jgi:phosphoheptose isomerase
VPDPLRDDAERLRAAGIEPAAVAEAARIVAGALRADRKVLIFGNGGSAADAQHVAAEFVGRFEQERRALPAIALTTDTSALTAIANDFGFDQVFARQVEALARRGDVVIGISTSGSSPNVLNGLAAARRAGATTIGLCGAPGCELCGSVDLAIAVDASNTASVQEAHLVAEHALCREVEQAVLAADASPPSGSVVSEDDLVAMRDSWRDAGLVMVWTNGCFDIVHAGHVASLKAARALGDLLVVGLNSDAAVRRLKGPGRPLMPAAERAALLAELRAVDYVVVFDEDTPERVLERLRPDIHTKGADYAEDGGKPVPERELVESYGGRVEILPLFSERSTSEIVEAIRKQEA